MPCLIALLALISPRLAIFLLYLFSDKPSLAFESGWLAIAGFLLLPWTTLAWIVCFAPPFGVGGFGWFIVAFAFLVDISAYVAGGKSRQSS